LKGFDAVMLAQFSMAAAAPGRKKSLSAPY
jgi:hypothetical protein